MLNESPNFLTCPAFEQLPKHAGAAGSGVPSGGKKEAEPQGKQPKWKMKKRAKRVLVIAAVLVAIAVLPFAVFALRASLAANSAKNLVQSAQSRLKNLDVAGAKKDIDSAYDSLTSLRDILRGSGFLRDLPGIGIQLRALEDAVSAGAGTLDSATDMLDVASVVVDALQGGVEAEAVLTTTGIAPTRRFQDLTKDEKLSLLRRFNDELPKMRLARDKMDLALLMWNRVPQDQLASPLRNALKPLAETIPVMKKALDEAVPIIEVVVPMAGYPLPRRFLIALQNDDEIRPAGGFIGTIGTMTWDAGEMSEFAFTDVYNIDNPVSGVWKEEPPEPIKKYLGLNNWFLRDANWSPDFPTSAERVLDFYIRESEMQLHAKLPHRPTSYLALEPGFFETLLDFTGPLTVDGETYTSENFFEKLEYAVEVEFHQKGIPVEKRKEIVSRLGDELVKKIFALPSSEWPKILDIVTQALQRKQILAYSRDQDLQQLFDARGWSGRAKAAEGDFVWVVDANLAALKTDGIMQKHIAYSLDATKPDWPIATITLRYTNGAKGFGDYRFTRYRTYTRVYVPEGSELLSSKGAMKDDLLKTGGKFVAGTVDVFRELGKTVFGAFWSVEPGKTGELTFTYRLPPVSYQLEAKSYRLDWPKQPGVDKATLTVDLLFDKNIQSAKPAEDKKDWGDSRYEYKTDSLTDRTFLISF